MTVQQQRRPPRTRSRAPARGVSVLHVLVPAEVGGLEAVVLALVSGARGSRVDARVAALVTPGRRDHPFLRSLTDAGVECFTIEAGGRGYLRERAAVARLCRRLRPDVVHTHGYRADVVDGSVARRLGFPVVSTVHGFTGGDRKNRFYQWLQRRALRKFDAVIAVSRPLRDDLAKSGVPRERLHYVQNAWAPATPIRDREAARAALGIAPDEFRVAWLGRLSLEKGPDLLLDAMPSLRDLPIRVSFVGAGPLRRALEARAAVLDLSDRIVWHGLVPRAAGLLPAFGAFVLSSRTEGTPIALLEAMAAGVPIVAARVGGVPDVVSEREALLVPPDDPYALAAALRSVVTDSAAARRRVVAAQSRLDHAFGREAWLEGYEAIYRGVLRACAASP